MQGCDVWARSQKVLHELRTWQSADAELSEGALRAFIQLPQSFSQVLHISVCEGHWKEKTERGTLARVCVCVGGSITNS